MNEFLKAWKNPFDFSSRSRRKDYWMFALINILVSLLVAFIPLVNVVYPLAVIVPQFALAVRRLHDVGKSGWWLLCPVPGVVVAAFAGFDQSYEMMFVGMGIAAIGGIALFVFSVMDSQPGPNQYGDNPKGNSGDGNANQETVIA
ncbi:DUF805 domain-containing protein [Vibrio penaeicida]|uniref:DUF805 domain-containing protein n=1 Tax=Vibrio penaeicida TaxID=104609 RepID=UPI000CE9C1A9|nr:DUF805 domain-containing protein [Vibrio penaeicida]